MDESIFRHRRFLVAAPHPDDAAFACGGMLGEAVRRGRAIAIATFCTRTFYVDGQRNGDLDGPTALRRREEESYAALLGPACGLHYFDYLDAIVRRGTLEAVFDPARGGPEDAVLAQAVAGHLKELAGEAGTALLLPVGLGRHADHWAVRDGGLGLGPGIAEAVYLWEDLPYAIDYAPEDIPRFVAEVAARYRLRAEAVEVAYPDMETVKQRGMDCYRSQDGDGSVSALTLKCGRRLRPDGGAERFWHLL
ncbi:MAG: PIG-L family deacetylase [Magnetospirillum sp. WYHS-4]